MSLSASSVLKTCCVCINKTSDFNLMQLTSKKQYNTKSWISKLKSCVTQIVWSKDYLICQTCAELLDSAYTFHQLCLESDEARKKILEDSTSYNIKTEDLNLDEPEDQKYHNDNCNDFVDGYDSSGDNLLDEITCNTCTLTFDTEHDLEDHRKNIHNNEDYPSKNCIKDKNVAATKRRKRNGKTNVSYNEMLTCNKNYVSRGRNKKMPKLENAAGDGDQIIINNQNLDVLQPIPDECESDQDLEFEQSDDKTHSEDSDAASDIKFTNIEKTEPKGNPDVPKLTFECTVCKNIFNKCTKLIKHALTEHGMEKGEVKPYACTDCPKRYNDSARWKEHYLKYHKSLQNEMCIYCSKTFSSKRALNIHEKRHQNKREYQCPFCPKRFNTISGRLTHKFTVHTDPMKWKYVCDLCNKRFYTRSKLDTHIRRHNNDKPYGCHLCDKKFCDSSELQMHLPSHTNVRDFKCPQCDKEYKREKNLKMHMAKDHNVDNGIKVYVKKKNHCCHMCPKAFYTKEKLMRHICSHTGEKPFPCTVCDKRFTDKWYATQHMKTVHDFVQETDY